MGDFTGISRILIDYFDYFVLRVSISKEIVKPSIFISLLKLVTEYA